MDSKIKINSNAVGLPIKVQQRIKDDEFQCIFNVGKKYGVTPTGDPEEDISKWMWCDKVPR